MKWKKKFEGPAAAVHSQRLLSAVLAGTLAVSLCPTRVALATADESASGEAAAQTQSEEADPAFGQKVEAQADSAEAESGVNTEPEPSPTESEETIATAPPVVEVPEGPDALALDTSDAESVPAEADQPADELLAEAQSEHSCVPQAVALPAPEGPSSLSSEVAGTCLTSAAQEETLSANSKETQAAPVRLSVAEPLTTQSKELLLDVELADSSLASIQINAVQLRKVDASGAPVTDFSGVVAAKYMVDQGRITLDLSNVALSSGQKLCVNVKVYNADIDFYSDVITVTAAAATAESTVEIVTQNLTADRSDFWVAVNFDSDKTARLNLYSYTGNSWTSENLIYSEFITPQATSQRITFGKDKLIAGGKVVAELLVFGGGTTQRTVSEAKSVASVPQKQKPYAAITSKRVTAGMTTISAALSFDAADTGSYVLYKLGNNTADLSQASVLASGSLYRSDSNKSIYLGTGKMAAGDRLQLVLTTESGEGRSAIVEVQPSPNWGQPIITFADAAVTPGSDTVNLMVRYADEYVQMGDDFYCDVSIYQVPGWYTDQEIEEDELWENSYIAQRVGQVNSNFGQATRGEVSVGIYSWVELKSGYRLFAKLRLPHTEWEGEEVDYVAASIPVLEEGEALPPVKVLLYNLGPSTARGAHIRTILAELGVQCETVAAADLNQTIGYLAGLSGFEKEEGGAGGSAPATEFMVMCGFSESLLDKFLDAMQQQSIRIDHKAIVTEYNRYYTLGQLIGDIEEEHEVFQALLALDKVIKAAEEVKEEQFGNGQLWAAFQDALVAANAVLASYEPALEQLVGARRALISAGNALTGGLFWSDEELGSGDSSGSGESSGPGGSSESYNPSVPNHRPTSPLVSGGGAEAEVLPGASGEGGAGSPRPGALSGGMAPVRPSWGGRFGVTADVVGGFGLEEAPSIPGAAQVAVSSLAPAAAAGKNSADQATVSDGGSADAGSLNASGQSTALADTAGETRGNILAGIVAVVTAAIALIVALLFVRRGKDNRA